MSTGPFASRPSRPRYVMADQKEPARLAAKVDARAWVDTYLSEHLTTDGNEVVPDGGTVVELGCGPAVLLAEVQRRRPDLHCIGIDVTAEHLRAAVEVAGLGRQRHPGLIRADAALVPLPNASCDLVYARFLLQYLRDPAAVVQEAARICRPGGRVLLQDLDGQLVSNWPPDPQLDPAMRLIETLTQTGFNPWIGRQLYSLAHSADLADITVCLEPYHLIAGRIDDLTRHLWKAKLDIASRALVRLGCPISKVARATAAYLDYLDRPDSLTYSVQFTVTGKARPGTFADASSAPLQLV